MRALADALLVFQELAQVCAVHARRLRLEQRSAEPKRLRTLTRARLSVGPLELDLTPNLVFVLAQVRIAKRCPKCRRSDGRSRVQPSTKRMTEWKQQNDTCEICG